MPEVDAKTQAPAQPGLAERLARLWQPRHRLFWPMLLFNALGAACAWALRTLPLNTAGLLLVGGMGLLNALFGFWAAWSLLQSPKPTPPKNLFTP